MKCRTLLTAIALVAIAAVAIIIAVNWPIGQPTQPVFRKLVFQLDWKAEPTFAGIYRAKDRLAKEGISLEIVEGNGAAYAAQTIGTGGSGWIGISSAATTAIARSNGVPVKSVAVLYPNSNSVIYSLESNPIRTPSDLRGKTIGLVPGSVTVAEYKALLKINNVDRSKVKEISVGFDPSPLLAGKTDALMTYAEALPVALRVQGHPIVTMPVRDFGVKTYAMNIIVNDRAAKEEKKAINKVLQAIFAEYDLVRSDPNSAADYFLKLFPDRDAKYVRESLKTVARLLSDGKIGRQTRQGWEETIQMLKDADLLGNREISIDEVAMTEYLGE